MPRESPGLGPLQGLPVERQEAEEVLRGRPAFGPAVLGGGGRLGKSPFFRLFEFEPQGADGGPQGAAHLREGRPGLGVLQVPGGLRAQRDPLQHRAAGAGQGPEMGRLAEVLGRDGERRRLPHS